MIEYLEALRVGYDRILESSSRVSLATRASRLPVDDVADLAYARASSRRGDQRARVESVTLSDGSTSSEPADIQRVFLEHFISLLLTQGLDQGEQHEEEVSLSCGTLAQLSGDACEALCAPATLKGVQEALGAMNKSPRPVQTA